MKIEIRSPKSKNEWDQYYQLRFEVLRKPHGMDRKSAHDELDPSSNHFGAFVDGQIVGVGRLHFNDDGVGQVRFMAVAEEFRSQGIGGRILDSIEETASQNNSKKIFLKARENAVNFYKKHGYRVKRKSNKEYFGIIHWDMEKQL